MALRADFDIEVFQVGIRVQLLEQLDPSLGGAEATVLEVKVEVVVGRPVELLRKLQQPPLVAKFPKPVLPRRVEDGDHLAPAEPRCDPVREWQSRGVVIACLHACVRLVCITHAATWAWNVVCVDLFLLKILIQVAESRPVFEGPRKRLFRTLQEAAHLVDEGSQLCHSHRGQVRVQGFLARASTEAAGWCRSGECWRCEVL